ncbi:hypothetical protein DFH11DRAFT_1562144 [Phellopilus nigrolimitatus]|nr:hypothetical protein DFH11DRAFT_1562144 [Phellopilus nigrolimitatus]
MISSFRSIFALVVFLLTNLVGVFPFHILVPFPTSASSFSAKVNVSLRFCLPSTSCCTLHPSVPKPDVKPYIRWHRFPINFQTAPLIAVLLLLATRVLDGTDVRQGIVGTNGIEPIAIMALFMSLVRTGFSSSFHFLTCLKAYLSVSLDTTGLFRFLAFWVARKGGASGRKLYFYLYLFFFVSGVAVGNDPVILFGTPFLAYFSHVTGVVPPTAWIFAQFSAANMASAVLPPSNLTNLVLTSAFSISFITYAAHTVLPAIAAGAAVYPVLAFGLFASRDWIPRQLDVVALQDPISPASAEPPTSSDDVAASSTPASSARHVGHAPGVLKDKFGAIFGGVLLSLALIVLIGTSPLKIQVWEVTVPPALIMLARDIWHDRSRWRKEELPQEHSSTVQGQAAGPSDVELQPLSISTIPPHQESTAKEHQTLLSLISDLKQEKLPTLCSILPRLPFSLVLFAFCMFILVQALTTRGWVEVFAIWWTAWVRVCSKAGSGSAIVGAIGGMLLVSVLLCNLCGTNIGTTILLARVLQSWLETSASSGIAVSAGVKLGSIYALALGTNFGAFTFSFSASLAGLLWRDILRQKGIVVRQTQFALLNLPIIGVATISAAVVLVAEMYVVKP